jgi:hypothetical protein
MEIDAGARVLAGEAGLDRRNPLGRSFRRRDRGGAVP